MDVEFFQFTKRYNSTKQPTVGGGTTFACQLKDPTTILNPVIVIAATSMQTVSTAPTIYNYAYIQSFGRYYTVDDWTWNNGVWNCALKVDVLASWKSNIVASTQYVLRAASRYNGAISDTLYPATCAVTQSGGTFIPFVNHSLNTGVYIVGIINNDQTNTQGAVTYYAMDYRELGNLKKYLLSDDFITAQSLDQISADLMDTKLLKTLFNPFQYIVSCKWFPVSVSEVSGAIDTVKIGWWTTNISCLKMAAGGSFAQEDGAWQIPLHPKANTRGSYLNYAPFAEQMLYFPPFGNIPIDTFATIPGEYVRWQVTVDFVSGKGNLELYRATMSGGTIVSGGMIGRYSSQIGVDIQLAQIGIDYVGAASTAVSAVSSTVGNIFSFNLGGAITSAASGIYNTLDAAMPQMATGGTNGAMIDYNTTAKIIFRFWDVVNDDNTHRGRPLCESVTLSSLSGYVMCCDAAVSIPGFTDEKTAIVNFLNGGCYIE